MKSFVIVACLAFLLLASSVSHAEILPTAFCSYCVNLFRNRGCLDSPSPFCRFLALKFTVKPLGADICDAFPCENYGQTTGNVCTGLLACPVNGIQPRGICPLNKLCCSTV